MVHPELRDNLEKWKASYGGTPPPPGYERRMRELRQRERECSESSELQGQGPGEPYDPFS